MVKAKVIAASVGAAISYIVVALADIDQEFAGEFGDWIEAVIVIGSTFGAGYMKRETRP